ncbi:MAG: DinB family protein [Bacteroidota bacterium]
MIPTDQIIADLDTNTQKLVASLSGFSPDEVIQKPNENTWSAAEVAAHLLRLDYAINRVLNAPSADASRPYDAKMDVFKNAMASIDRAFSAPESMIPSATPKNIQYILDQIKGEREKIKTTIRTTDLTQICLAFDHPYFGEFSKYEWIYFNISHTERHLKQLERIREQVCSDKT